MKQRHAGRIVLLAATLACATATPARAELRIAGEAGWFSMTGAGDSAKAIFDGSSGGPIFGGSLGVGIGQHFFVQANGRFFQKDGERVFVESPGGEVFRLGHPVTVQIIPAYGLIGYRFGNADSSLRPYLALGGGVTMLKETSTIGGENTSTSESKPAGHAALGADYGRGALRFGLELGYSTVPDSIGLAGVSEVFGETNIGGFTAVARISFVR
jgi:hypothetical protein